MLEVRRWAEIRRMKEVEGLSIHEIASRTGHDRNTVRRALRRDGPPRYGRPPRPSKLEPFVAMRSSELLRSDPTLSGVRIREELEQLGYEGGKTILDDLLREVRPRFRAAAAQPFSAPSIGPASWRSSTSASRAREIPVGWGQTRRGYVVTCELPYSRAFAGALVFSKEFADIAFGMSRCLARLGALPGKLVWDREGAIAPRGRPTERSLGVLRRSSRSAG